MPYERIYLGILMTDNNSINNYNNQLPEIGTVRSGDTDLTSVHDTGFSGLLKVMRMVRMVSRKPNYALGNAQQVSGSTSVIGLCDKWQWQCQYSRNPLQQKRKVTNKGYKHRN